MKRVIDLVLDFDCLPEAEVVVPLLQRVEVYIFVVLYEGITRSAHHSLFRLTVLVGSASASKRRWTILFNTLAKTDAIQLAEIHLF